MVIKKYSSINIEIDEDKCIGTCMISYIIGEWNYMIDDKIKEIPGAEEYLKAYGVIAQVGTIISGIFLGLAVAFLSMMFVISSFVESAISEIKAIPLVGDIAAREVMKIILSYGEKIFSEIIKTGLTITGIVCLVIAIPLIIYYLYYNNRANLKYQEYVNNLKKWEQTILFKKRSSHITKSEDIYHAEAKCKSVVVWPRRLSNNNIWENIHRQCIELSTNPDKFCSK